jgi:hypothetical protein
MLQTQEQNNGGQVILRLDHIDSEIKWPEFDGEEMSTAAGTPSSSTTTASIRCSASRASPIRRIWRAKGFGNSRFFFLFFFPSQSPELPHLCRKGAASTAVAFPPQLLHVSKYIFYTLEEDAWRRIFAWLRRMAQDER